MSEQSTHPQKYHIGLRVLHWLIAALMLGAVVAGFVMEDLPLELKRQVVSLHISVGITVLALAIIRLVMRVTTSVPAIPDGLHSWQGKAGRAVHYLFYVTMLAIPISGYLMVTARGKTPSWFGLDLPVLIAPNETLAEIAYESHEYIAFAFIGLFVLHVAAALKHLLIDKLNLFKRIA